MKAFPIVLFALGLLTGCTPPTGDTEHLRIESGEDQFVVWQGFDHAWSHNHRWNRFGNWVEVLDDCDTARCFGMAHSAASGTSRDTARFQGDLVQITAPGVGFVQAIGEVDVSDQFQEEDLWTRVQTVRIPLAELPASQAEPLRGRDTIAAVLNGWDLFAQEGWAAAKPIDFALEVDPPRYMPGDDSIEVVWRAFLRMGCSTEECLDEGVFNYRVKAQLAILAWDDELTVGDSERFGHTYTWDAPANSLGHGDNPAATELELPAIAASLPRSLPGGSGFVGIQRLLLHLFQWKEGVINVDQHMLEWRSRVGTPDADGAFPVELMFKNWTEGMGRYQTFAYKDIGAASMASDLMLFELPDPGAVEKRTWSGYHSWPGQEQSASDDAQAVTRSWEQAQ